MEFSDLYKFDKFVTPVLTKFMYWVGLIVIAICALSALAGASLLSRYSGSETGVGSILVILIVGALAALTWRVICEIWLVIFSINDRLGLLARKPTD